MAGHELLQFGDRLLLVLPLIAGLGVVHLVANVGLGLKDVADLGHLGVALTLEQLALLTYFEKAFFLDQSKLECFVRAKQLQPNLIFAG